MKSGEFPVYDKNITYYIPGNCVSLDKGGDSLHEIYVAMTYNGSGYDYYFTSRDETNMGIYLTYQELLDVDVIKSGVEEISTDIGVGDRKKILLLDDTCNVNTAVEKLPTSNIKDKEKSDISGIPVATDESCFTFDSSAGAIIGYSYTCPRDVVIPSKIGGVNVTTIGDQAFWFDRLKSVIIPNSVTTI